MSDKPYLTANPFFICWNPQSSQLPTVMHETEALAVAESERLAIANIGQEFIVLKAVTMRVATDVVSVDVAATDRGALHRQFSGIATPSPSWFSRIEERGDAPFYTIWSLSCKRFKMSTYPDVKLAADAAKALALEHRGNRFWVMSSVSKRQVTSIKAINLRPAP